MDRKTQINLWYIIAAFMAFSLLQGFYQASKQYTVIPYSRFQTLLDENKIEKVWVAQNDIQGILKEPEKDGVKQFITTRVSPDLVSELDKHHVTYFGEAPSTLLPDLLSWVVPPLLFVGLWMFFIRRMGQGSGGLMAVGKSRAKIYVETDTKVTFADVAGVDEAKDELKQIVDFLRNPRKIRKARSARSKRDPSGRTARHWQNPARSRRRGGGGCQILFDFRIGIRRNVRGGRRRARTRPVRTGPQAGSCDHLHRRA